MTGYVEFFHKTHRSASDGSSPQHRTEHATKHYVGPDGEPTNEQLLVKIVSRNTRAVYGDLSAAEFGPLALKAVRQKFIDLGWCRKTVNQQIERLRPDLSLGGRRGTCAAQRPCRSRRGARLAPRPDRSTRDTEPVKPVSDTVVDATLPFLGRHVRTMIELQRVTGMRPGEVCQMRLEDIDRTGMPWVYRPTRHKTQHLGKDRAVMIGPKGKAVIEAFIAGGSVVDPSGPLFSPRRMREERFAAMRAERKTKVQPSQVDRREKNPDPKKMPAEQYTPKNAARSVELGERLAAVEKKLGNKVDVSAQAYLAQQYVKSGNLTAGAKLFEVTAPLDAKLEAWHYKEAATTWMKAKDKDKALAAAKLSEKAATPEKRSEQLTHFWHRALGEVFLEAGEPKAAIPHCEKAVTSTKLAGYIKDCQAKLAQAEEAAKK